MKKYYFIFIFILFIPKGSYSQGGFKSNIVLPYSKLHKGYGIIETTNGNYLHVGIVVDTLNGYQTNRLCILNLNSNNQVNWVKKYGNSKFVYNDNFYNINWIKKIQNNNYVIASTIDSNLINAGALIKINNTGDTIWQSKFKNSTNDIILINDVINSNDNGLLLTGAVYTDSTALLLIIKTSNNGKELWRKIINKSTNNGPDYQIGMVIAQDSITKRIVIGGTQMIGNSTNWNQHCNIVITDSLGNFLNRKTFATNTAGVICSLIQCKDGKFIVSGGINYGETFNTFKLNYGYVAKFDLEDINPIWQKKYMDEKSPYNAYTKIIEESNGNITVAGSQDTCFTKNLPFNLMSKITKLDKDGNLINKKYYNYNPDFNSTPQSAFLLNLYGFNKTSDNGYISCFYDQNGSAPRKFFIVKYDSLGCDTTAAYCATVGFKEQNYQAIDVSIYPQPAKQFINLQSVLFANKKAQVNISNAIGQICYNASVQFNNGNSQLNLANLPKGIYFLKLVDEDLRSFSSKIVLE